MQEVINSNNKNTHTRPEIRQGRSDLRYRDVLEEGRANWGT